MANDSPVLEGIIKKDQVTIPNALRLVDDIMDMSVPSEFVDIVVDKAAFLVNGRAIVDS